MTQDLVTIDVQRGKRSFIYKLPRDRYEAQVEQAKDLLKHAGYISPVERRELEGLLSKTERLEFTDPERTKGRIEQFQEAGIPAIYDQRFDESDFPTLDFLIQFPTGIYQRRAAADAIKRRKLRIKRSGRIHPSTLKDIVAFRTLAFDDDQLSDQVVREFDDYIHTKDLKGLDGDAVAKMDLLQLKYLEQALKDVAPDQREYHQFKEGDPLQFLRKRFWHVQYTPEDRARIAEDFVRRLQAGEAGLARKEVLPRMAQFFPEVVDREHDLEQIRKEKLIRECSDTRDYRGIPQVVLIDSRYGTKYIKELQDHVKRMCEEKIAEDPLHIFEPLQSMHQPFKVPYGLLYLDEFRAIVTEKRLEVLKGLDDDTFARYFGTSHGRTASIGHRQFVDEGLLDTQFRSLLLDRYRDI